MVTMTSQNNDSQMNNNEQPFVEQQAVYQTNMSNANGRQQYYTKPAPPQTMLNISQMQHQQQLDSQDSGVAKQDVSDSQRNTYDEGAEIDGTDQGGNEIVQRDPSQGAGEMYENGEMNGETYGEDEPMDYEQADDEEEEDEEYEENDAFANVGQGLTGQYKQMMMQYWQEVINNIEREDHDFKNHQLPLARIKKVMKTDEAVRMISAEAPILFAKCCDIFITELTMRAWIHAEENKRRTLQKSDICAALQKSDMFDFLIDIVPREPQKHKKPQPDTNPQ